MRSAWRRLLQRAPPLVLALKVAHSSINRWERPRRQFYALIMSLIKYSRASSLRTLWAAGILLVPYMPLVIAQRGFAYLKRLSPRCKQLTSK